MNIYDQSDVIRCWYNFIYILDAKPELIKLSSLKMKSEIRQINQENKRNVKSKYKVNELKITLEQRTDK